MGPFWNIGPNRDSKIANLRCLAPERELAHQEVLYSILITGLEGSLGFGLLIKVDGIAIFGQVSCGIHVKPGSRRVKRDLLSR
jgi:hypothetical protein